MTQRCKRPMAMAAAWWLVLAWSAVDLIHARSLEGMQQSGKIRVCFSPIHPFIVKAEPEGCIHDCTFSGAVYEEVLAFVDTLDGVKPTCRRVDWDEQFWNAEGKTDRDASHTPTLLASGACDLYPSNLTITAWRQKKLDFVPLFQSRMMVVVNQEDKHLFREAKDLAGKVAAVLKDTSLHIWPPLPSFLPAGKRAKRRPSTASGNPPSASPCTDSKPWLKHYASASS